jgi:hypothetical protein
MTTPFGYSGKPLAVKLGIKSGLRVALLNAPTTYITSLGMLPEGVIVATTLEGAYDLIHLFVVSRAELEASYPHLRRSLVQNGAIWISWPKRRSNMTSDLSEDVVRAIGLANHMGDVKVATVDEIWSALKFVIRLTERKT